MRAIIVVDIPDDQKCKASYDLYDKVKKYNGKLMPMPEYNDCINPYFDEAEKAFEAGYNACVREIING